MSHGAGNRVFKDHESTLSDSVDDLESVESRSSCGSQSHYISDTDSVVSAHSSYSVNLAEYV